MAISIHSKALKSELLGAGSAAARVQRKPLQFEPPRNPYLPFHRSLMRQPRRHFGLVIPGPSPPAYTHVKVREIGCQLLASSSDSFKNPLRERQLRRECPWSVPPGTVNITGLSLLSGRPRHSRFHISHSNSYGIDGNNLVILTGLIITGTTHPTKEIIYTITDSDPSLIILHPSFSHMKTAIQEACPDIPFFDLIPLVASTKSLVPLPPFHASLPQSRRALMIYTSGTTSNPKGCVTTHKNITFQAECLAKAWEYTPADHLIHVLPLHHVHGIINGLTATLLAGATVEMHTKFDPAVVWRRWCDRGSSTMFFAVPTVYSRLVDYFDAHIRSTELEPDARRGTKALRLVVSGSAALPTPIKTKFAEITGQVLLERYGMTEIGMGISCGLDIETRIDGSVGWPLPGVQVRLTNKETGQVVAVETEEAGMIEVKGDNVFLEYWRRPEATAKEFTADGWFKTGDVAKRDSNGAYYIQGRASVDLIKSGGYKISALEVERKMLALDEIQEVVVVGLADEEWGQRVAAVVKQRSGTPALELSPLRIRLREEMASYKVPTVLKLVDNIERNAMGKVNKRDIIKTYWPDKA
ncbi:acyl-CoA synthetase [Histoplasma capsulatum G186AR]|uniref:Acyl-CoA synthetase n=1 Tax=Ajellomyces capsulatus (strain G186AR / H82 / ATCC MYA-2454 / RMSCC 2432) TaxID=447093 RepID=C0NLH4_AJECG|nr:acyl-CoA synthetase [Histoplasma capsulatum G186AR]EEH07475.1 acyl-CoA synthetase [Histoplasma capsulatum G186AR]